MLILRYVKLRLDLHHKVRIGTSAQGLKIEKSGEGIDARQAKHGITPQIHIITLSDMLTFLILLILNMNKHHY